MIQHHAVLVVGDKEKLVEYTQSFFDVDTEYERVAFSELRIQDVRDLIKNAYSKPFESKTKTILLEATGIALEAQQALLKLFEDPPPSTKFILSIPSPAGLLPTLLSRLHIAESNKSITVTTNSFFTIFQNSSFAGRLETIAHITKEKDVQQIDLICSGVLGFIAQKPDLRDRSILLDCLLKIPVRGASKKMLLEEIALTLPVVSVHS